MFIRFLMVGGIGFGIDAGLTWLLIQLTVAPWLARVPALLVAMTFTWLANRSFTYRVRNARTADEAMRYALVASITAVINYSIYVALVRYGVWPVGAVALATLVQAVASFQLYRRVVFGGQR
jgi:putative flippase GtrA